MNLIFRHNKTNNNRILFILASLLFIFVNIEAFAKQKLKVSVSSRSALPKYVIPLKGDSIISNNIANKYSCRAILRNYNRNNNKARMAGDILRGSSYSSNAITINIQGEPNAFVQILLVRNPMNNTQRATAGKSGRIINIENYIKSIYKSGCHPLYNSKYLYKANLVFRGALFHKDTRLNGVLLLSHEIIQLDNRGLAKVIGDVILHTKEGSAGNYASNIKFSVNYIKLTAEMLKKGVKLPRGYDPLHPEQYVGMLDEGYMLNQLKKDPIYTALSK